MVLGSASAAPKTTIIKAPVILKINQYYILYTSPGVPYIDEQNRFMIPLRAISELMGARVDYTAAEKKASIAWEGKTVEVTINSKTVVYNGKESEIDTVPVIKQGQIFVPIRVILDGLNVKSSWDTKDQLLSITDEKFRKSKIITRMEDGTDRNNTDKGRALETNDIRPLSFVLTLSEPGQNSELTIKAKNISGQDMAEGVEDLRATSFTDNGYQFTDNSHKKTPTVKAGATFEQSYTIRLDDETINYVVAVGKTAG